MADTKVIKYRDYIQTLLDTDAWRIAMADALLNRVPPELQNNIFERLAVATLPSAMYFSSTRSSKRDGYFHRDGYTQLGSLYYKIPSRIMGDSTLAAAVSLVLGGLSKLKVEDPDGRRLRSSLAGKPGIATETTAIVKVFGKQVEEAVIKNVTVIHESDFKGPGQPNKPPYPSCLEPHSNHITSLTLTIKVGSFRRSGEIYPSQLYLAQDNVPLVKQTMRSLSSLTVHIIESRYDETSSLPIYRARLGSGEGPFTTRVKEIARVVDSLRTLTISQSAIRFDSDFSRDNSHFLGPDDFPARDDMDLTHLSAQEVANAITEGADVRYLV